jgi:hypothetical protein
VPVIVNAPPNYAHPHPPLTVPNGNGTTIWVGKGGPGEREGSLQGNSLAGRAEGRGRPQGPAANSTVVFSGGATGRSGGSVDSTVRGNPRDHSMPTPNVDSSRSGGGAQGRWQQAPASRVDSGRNDSGRFNSAPASRTESPRFNPGPAPQMHSAPPASPQMSAPPSHSAPAAPSAPARSKQ